MEEQKRKRSVITGLLTFLILTALIVFFVHRIDQNIFDTLKATSPVSLVVLFLFGFLYNLLEATVCRTIFHDRIPGFSILNALDVTYTGVFGNVATFSAGSLPMQSYYLYRKGLMVGSGVGLMNLEYIFHKASILLYATVFLCLQGKRMHTESSALLGYLLVSYVICLVIIAALALLCTWEKIRDFAFFLIRKLPEKGKWIDRKAVWENNLSELYSESHKLLRNKKCFCKIMLLNLCKLFVLYSIPYVCFHILGIHTYSFFQVLALSSFMLLISSAIPNIAGMGSVEFSFFLVFYSSLGEHTMAALLLYRLSTYYFQFFLSAVWVLGIQRKYLKNSVNKAPV